MEQNPCVPFLSVCCVCYGGSRWSVARLSQSKEGLMGSEKESRLATQVYKKCTKDWKARRGQRMYRGACVTDQWSVEKCSRGEKVLTNKWIIAGFQVWNVSVRQKYIKEKTEGNLLRWTAAWEPGESKKEWVIVPCKRRMKVENRPAKDKDEAGREVMSWSMRSQWGETHADTRMQKKRSTVPSFASTRST